MALSPEGEVVQRYEVPEGLASTMPRGKGLGTLEPYRARSGVVGLLSRGGGWSAVSAYSGAGEQLWSWKRLPHAGREHAPNELSAGDLDGDGAAEFVVGTNGSGGVFFLDDHGRIEHRVPGGNEFSAAILDLDGDGRLEVMHTGDHRFLVRDAEGELLEDMPRPAKLSPEFLVVEGGDGAPRVAQFTDQMLHLMRPDGSDHQRVRLPGVTRGDGSTIAWWRRDAESESLLVVSARGEVRAELFLFDETRRLVHHERVGGTGTSGVPLVTLSRVDAPDALLVGTHDGLWLYEFPDAR